MRLARQALLATSWFIAACTPLADSPLKPLVESRKAAVLVFLAPDCPLSRNYTPTLNELRSRFLGAGMEVYAVFPGRTAADHAETFARDYALRLPVLKDTDYRFADLLGATTTPEAFVVDGAGHTRYTGAIDNRAPELGQRRTVITQHYLQDALASLAEGRPIPVEKTRPVGCFIERTPPS